MYPQSRFWIKNKQNRYSPVDPFFYIKMDFKGSYTSRTCLSQWNVITVIFYDVFQLLIADQAHSIGFLHKETFLVFVKIKSTNRGILRFQYTYTYMYPVYTNRNVRDFHFP